MAEQPQWQPHCRAALETVLLSAFEKKAREKNADRLSAMFCCVLCILQSTFLLHICIFTGKEASVLSISAKDCGAVILAGGQSRRMGSCKAALKIEGLSMAARIASELALFDELRLSVSPHSPVPDSPLPCIEDIYSGRGPLGGLHAALFFTKKSAVFITPCDLPQFSVRLPQLLLQQMDDAADAIVCRDSLGHLHPLCGIYRTRILPAAEEQLRQERLRMSDFLSRISCQELHTAGLLPDSDFFNMNTPEEYCAASEALLAGSGMEDVLP